MGDPEKRRRRRKPRQARSRALVEAIVEATVQSIQRSGSESVPMRAIAERAGVAVGSVYEYFSDREGIMDAVVDRITAENFDRFSSVLLEHESSTLEETFAAVMDAVLELYLSRGAVTRASIKTILRFARLEAVTLKRDQFVEKVAARIQRDLPSISHEAAHLSALAVTDMTMGVIVSELYRPASAARTNAMVTAVRRMIRAETEHLRSGAIASPETEPE